MPQLGLDTRMGYSTRSETNLIDSVLGLGPGREQVRAIDSDSIGSHPSQSKHPFRHPNPLYSLAEHPFHPSFGGRT